MVKSFLFLLVSISLSFSGELLPFPFIYVEGTADTSVPPNIASITFWVTDLNVESSPAIEKVERISEEIIDSLRALGINSENITAYELTKDMKKDWQNKELNILGYECSRKFEVKLFNLTIYDHISQYLFSMNSIDMLRIDFNRNDKNIIDSVLISKACKNAKTTAEQLAGSLNSKIRRLYAISQNQFYTMPTKFGLDNKFGDSGTQDNSSSGEKLLVPQLIEIHGRINAIFEMKK